MHSCAPFGETSTGEDWAGTLDFMIVVDPNYRTDKLGYSVKSSAVKFRVVNGAEVEHPARVTA